LYSSGLSLRKTSEKDFCDLLRGIILPSGIGFKSTKANQEDTAKEKEKENTRINSR
jgi:hypothetical protein